MKRFCVKIFTVKIIPNLLHAKNIKKSDFHFTYLILLKCRLSLLYSHTTSYIEYKGSNIQDPGLNYKHKISFLEKKEETFLRCFKNILNIGYIFFL